MAYTDDYVKTNWVNKPSTNTPLNQTNLNHAEQGIKNNCGRVANLSTTKAEQSDLLTVFKSVSFDSATGTFTFTRFNDTVVTINTDLEKIAVNFDYDDDPTSPHYQNLIITLADGTVKYADLSALITQYEFTDTATIDITVSGTGTISASVIDGSITASKLQPNYLADVTAQASIATNGANTATSQALVSEGWAKGTQNGTPVTSGSPYYENNAEWFKNKAQQIAGQTLDGLSNVTITTPTNGQPLTYDADNNIWRNSDGGSVETKSGNPLAITTDSAQVAQSTTITLNPIQASGTPTPANPLPISGYDKVTMSGGGNSLSLPLPETVYGGTLDVESGVLTVTHFMANVTANDNFTLVDGISIKTDDIYPTIKSVSGTTTIYGVSNLASSAGGRINANFITSYGTNGTGGLEFRAIVNSWGASAWTVQAWRDRITALGGTIQVCCELATPYNIQLNPQQVALLAGANTLTSNGTTITVIYREGKIASLADVETTNRQMDAKIRPITINTEVGNPITFATDSVQTAIGTSVVLEPIQASGTPTPSNPLPISGYNNIEVKVPLGANQWDEQWELGSISSTTGATESSSVRYRSKNFNRCIPNTTYYYKRGTGDYSSVFFYDENKNYLGNSVAQTVTSSRAFTVPSNAHYFKFYVNNVTTYNNDISINYPADVTTYSPFSLVTGINLTLPNTVYGGNYNVEYGILTVTHAIVDMGDLIWSYISSANVFVSTANPPGYPVVVGGRVPCVCSIFKTIDSGAWATSYADKECGLSIGGAQFVAKDTDYTDGNAFKTAVTGQKIVYELATPYQISLTPQQVHLPNTKDQGGRTMWTNGTAISMTYRKGEMASLWNTFAMGVTLNSVSKQAFETKGYIKNICDISVEGTTNTSGTQINSGDYFFLNGVFCKALSNIATNATFTLNTNYKTTTIAKELTALFNA